MADFTLTGGTVFLNGEFVKTNLLIRGGVVARIGDDVLSDVNYDCTGKIIVPGLVDAHVHLRQPGFEYKETIKSGTQAAAHGGYTTVCPMPNLNPVPDSVASLETELAAIRENALINVLPFGAITVGEKGESLADIAGMAGLAVGFSDDGKGVQSDDMMRAAMLAVKQNNSFISAHCEDESLLSGGAIHEGEYAKIHGMKGISSASEYVPIIRDIKLAEETGAKYHICHISAGESIEAVRQGKARGVQVSCEVTPHHIALIDMDMCDDGTYKMNPPLRGESDRAAIIEGLKDGTIDIIATDHAPHSAEEKAKGLEQSAFGIVGSETAFAVCYTELVRGGHISLESLIGLMATKPAELLGIKSGIKEGERADIAVFDIDNKYTINSQDFLSKGRSTPFEGREVYGQTYLTICDGEIVYRRQ